MSAEWNESLGCITYRTSRSTGVGRRGWTTKAFGELLKKSAANVISGDMDSISNSKDNQRTFRRKWKTGVGGIQSRSRSLLNLANSGSTFSDDGSNQNMWYEKAKRVCFRQ